MSNQPILCPVCEEGHLHEAHFAGDFKHGDRTIHVEGLECYRCDACGADPVFEEQIRRNHLKVADAKRKADGLLTGEEVRAIREKLGLSQSEAAELFGGGANAFSKYERGDVLQSKAMDRLLRLTSRYRFMLDDLRSMAGVGERGWTTAAPSDQRSMEMNAPNRASLRDAKVVQISQWEKAA